MRMMNLQLMGIITFLFSIDEKGLDEISPIEINQHIRNIVF